MTLSSRMPSFVRRPSAMRLLKFRGNSDDKVAKDGLNPHVVEVGSNESDDDVESTAFIADSKPNHSAPSTHGSLCWQISTILLLILVVIQLAYIAVLGNRTTDLKASEHSYATGFDTDFAGAAPAFGLVKRRFTNALHVFPNGSIEATRDLSQPEFVGAPSNELDDVWVEMTGHRYFAMTDAEIDTLNADPSVPPVEETPPLSIVEHAGVYGGLDFMHSLHCLNALRRHLDMPPPDVNQTMASGLRIGRLHVDHCVDQLRQAILCHADATPVTLKPVRFDSNGAYMLVGETEREHTCRDGNALLRWVKERAAKTGFVDVKD